MGSDFVADDASLAGFSRDIARKKKIHRSAKLKQCKLDARREQWLSQVKNKDCLVTSRGMPAAYPPPQPASSKKLDRRVKEGEKKEGVGVSVECDGSSSHDSEEGSPTHGNSLSECPGDRIGRGSSFGSSSISISDADVEGDDTEDRGEVEEEEMDDWETLADALTAHDCSQPDPTPPAPTIPDATAAPGRINNDNQDGFEKPGDRQIVHRAWKPDDTFRPQSLPNLLKQRSFPASMGRHYEAAGRAQRGILSMPSSCPICYEDLDRTDSSFLPCNCGFRLCLFCHKRIVEADGRCPGCRKHYAPMACDEMATSGRIPTADFRLYRSCSMRSRN